MIDPSPYQSTGPLQAEWQRGVGWVRHGWERFQHDRTFWLGVGGVYLVFTALVGALPFVGPLLVALFTPILAAGVLIGIEHGAEIPATEDYRRWIVQPAKLLLRALLSDSHLYLVVLLGIVTLGLMVLVWIVESLIGIGSLIALADPRTAGIPLWLAVSGGPFVVALNIALLMGLFYSPHGTALAGRDAMQAVHESFNACRRRPLPHLVFLVLIGVAYLVIASAFSLSLILGYLLLFGIGAVLLPVLTLASYESYTEIFSPVPRV